MKKAKDIDEYISAFPADIQEMLQQLRNIIQKAAPGATETISYAMPAFKLEGILVWFAAHSTHIGFYPRASVIEVFSKELAAYKTSKGTIQFPLDAPLPVDLITMIVKYRLKDLQRAKTKTK